MKMPLFNTKAPEPAPLRYAELCRTMRRMVETLHGPGQLAQVFRSRVGVIVTDPKGPKRFGGKVMRYYDLGRVSFP